jgi:hypothetical protein
LPEHKRMSASQRHHCCVQDGTIRIWDLTTRVCTTVIDHERGQGVKPRDVAALQDGGLVSVGGAIAVRWEPGTWQPLFSIDLPSPVMGLSVLTPDGGTQEIACVLEGGGTHILDALTGALIRELPTPAPHGSIAAHALPHGGLLTVEVNAHRPIPPQFWPPGGGAPVSSPPPVAPAFKYLRAAMRLDGEMFMPDEDDDYHPEFLTVIPDGRLLWVAEEQVTIQACHPARRWFPESFSIWGRIKPTHAQSAYQPKHDILAVSAVWPMLIYLGSGKPAARSGD